MASYDVDFAHVRRNAKFAAILGHYGIAVNGQREQQKVLCPFHDDAEPSLNVNLVKKIFHCFACGRHGNVIEFVQQLEGQRGQVMNIRVAAERTAELSQIAVRGGGSVSIKAAVKPRNVTDSMSSDEPGLVVVNRPLTFALKLDTVEHAWLASRGLRPDLLRQFGAGIAERGLMKGRLAMPVHTAKGELVAYCGRYLADEVPAGEAKYLLPEGFRKDLELYGLRQALAAGRLGTAVLVESPLSVIVNSGGSDHTDRPALISTMGRSISAAQVGLLVEHGYRDVAVVFDGDQAGRDGAAQVAGALASGGIWAIVHAMPEGAKPHDHCGTDADGFWSHALAPFDFE